jgi:L-aspartate oxidase
VGSFGFDRKHGERIVIFANATMLATGGAGQIYRHTTNPGIATGSGMAMAYRAGAEIWNMEFVQFHPTSLYHPDGNSFLISEAVRGEGARLKLKNGSTFMENYHARAELAPRDTVARAINSELIKSGESCVYLDLTHLDHERIRARFPSIYARCLELDIDITKEQIPVVPAAHYFCGGVRTDFFGRTTIDGLFAAGETACTGVHGANRLASNSLLEAVVFACRAVQKACSKGSSLPDDPSSVIEPFLPLRISGESRESIFITHDMREIQNIMWDFVGIVRSDARLSRADRRLRLLEEEIKEYHSGGILTPDSVELQNMVDVALLVTHSALRRKESRGLHFNVDHPERDDENWRKNMVLKKA